MKSLTEEFGVALCGLMASVLVAVANVAVARMAGFNFFTLLVWGIVPAGAIFTGFAAASGYYFGSLYFHRRADVSLLVQMVLVAGFAQFLIYWLGYVTLVLDDGRRVADLVSFGRYLDFSLTNAHYVSGRAQADTGVVGARGYWLAAFQFVGFLVGGLGVYVYLRSKPVCQACNRYMRRLAKKKKVYANSEEAPVYYDKLFTHPIDSEEFAALIRSEAKVKRPKKGALQVDTVLLGCPQCKGQMIVQDVWVNSGRAWEMATDLKRHVQMPEGADLVPLFRA